MNDNEYSEEIVEYTVYKSKLEFDRLKKAILQRETMTSVLNTLLLVIFGIIDIVLQVISFIFKKDEPMLAIIPLAAVTKDPDD
jgi:hypothetical protein